MTNTDRTATPGRVPDRHQRRALLLVEAVAGPVDVETSIPVASRHIDALLEPHAASRVWGPLRAAIDRRPLVIEHFSRPPDRGDLATAHMKVAWALAQWARGDRWPGSAPPVGLVVSVGRPRGALRELEGFARDPDTQGLYWARGLARLALVDVRGLEERPDTAFLRAFDHRPRVAAARLKALYEGGTMSASERRDLEVAMKREPKAFDPSEFDELLVAREKRGVKRGVKRGEERGRAALLDVARLQLPPSAVRRLERIKDLERLRRRLLELLEDAGG